MFERLALAGQFDLGDDQAVIVAVKDVDLPAAERSSAW